MKKSLLTLALTAMVSLTASAVSIDWTSTALSFNGTVLKSNKAVSAYLVQLSGGDFSTYTIDSLFTPETVGDVVSSDGDGSSKAGKMVGRFTFTYDDAEDGLKEYNNGDTFALLVSYANPDENGEMYYNLSNIKGTLSGLVDDTSNVFFADFEFNNARGIDPTLTAGGGWVKAVPEPATGALALAGLALLFRRKRA